AAIATGEPTRPEPLPAFEGDAVFQNAVWSRDGHRLGGGLVRPSRRQTIAIYDPGTKRHRDLGVEATGKVTLLEGERSRLFPPNGRLMSLDVATQQARAVEVPAGTSGGRASDWIGGIDLPVDQRTLFVLRTRSNGEIWQMTLDQPRPAK